MLFQAQGQMEFSVFWEECSAQASKRTGLRRQVSRPGLQQQGLSTPAQWGLSEED